MLVLDYSFVLFFLFDKKENDFCSINFRVVVFCDLNCIFVVYGVLIFFELMKVIRGCNLW